MGSTWGNTIKISIFGESHGTGIGVVIDGFPSGVAYDEAFVLREMERRAPGRNKQSTARKEPDRPEIQSGIYNGKTTGTPICVVIRNTDQRSNDYAELAAQPRERGTQLSPCLILPCKSGCKALSVTFGDSSPRGRAKGCPIWIKNGAYLHGYAP